MINIPLAFRSLLKTPLVTGVAVVSLALGIGANAAIFSIFERMILRPVPAQSPEELVNLADYGPKPGSQSTNLSGRMESIFSYPMFRDLERAESALDGIAGYRSFGVNLAYEGSTASGLGFQVSGGYFDVLGLKPAAGRLIGPADDITPGAHTVAVLGHHYWRNRFDSDPGVVGKTLVINGKPQTIIGVAPEGFEGTTLGNRPEVFVPLSMREALVPGWEGFENRRRYWIYAFGRLQDGVTLEQAQASLAPTFTSLIKDVELPLQDGMSERGLEQFTNKTLVLEPGSRGQSNIQRETRTPLLLLLGVTGFVLLIACANIANLLLVKANNRSGEIAVRMSIGAQRHQLVAQFLTESFLLATGGGLLGFLVAKATVRILGTALPAGAPLDLNTAISPMTWLFLGILVLVTGLMGLFPALHSTRTELVTALKSQAGKSSPSKTANRFRAAMATLQIALSMTLLISAGLFTKSLLNVSEVDLGIEIENLAAFGLAPELNGYSFEASRNLFVEAEEKIAALPGITGVTACLVPLISGNNWGSNVSVQGFESGPDVDDHSNYNEVGPGFFRTLGIPLLAGREFDERDAVGSPGVAIVNETFAEKFGLGRDAVGKRMAVGGSDELDLEIVGLVADSKYSEVKDTVPPLFFLPYRQDESIGMISFYVRSPLDTTELLTMLRKTVAGFDPNLPLEEVRTMQMQVEENIFLDRVMSSLSAAFALLATLLASIGLYGVMAYSVAQRTREIGLRMALGADAGRVRSLILRQVGLLTLVGGVIGTAAAFGLGKAASSLLYGLEGHDPLVFGGAAVLVALVSLGAGLLPAQRAAHTDPLVALREE